LHHVDAPQQHRDGTGELQQGEWKLQRRLLSVRVPLRGTFEGKQRSGFAGSIGRTEQLSYA
jgi:hypothetical protein